MERMPRRLLSDAEGAEAPSHSRDRLGSALYPNYESTAHPEVGHIQAVHTARAAVDVKTTTGRLFFSLPYPDSTFGFLQVPSVGQRVLVNYDAGFPPQLKSINTSITRPAVALGDIGGGRASAADAGTGFASAMPGGLRERDLVRVTSTGGVFAQLDDGTLVLKASELSKILVSPLRDLLRLVGRRLELLSGPGQLIFDDDGGKGNLKLELGVDEQTESHPEMARWLLRANIGRDGDLIDVRVTLADGTVVWRHHVSPLGDVESQATSLDLAVDENADIRVDGDTRLALNRVELSASSMSIRAQSLDAGFTGSMRLHATGTVSLRALRGPLFLSASAGFRAEVSGGALATPLTDAMRYTVTNGSVVFDVGSPLALDLGLARSGFRVQTYGGDIRLESVGGGIALNTLVPGALKLGGPAVPHPGAPWPGLFAAVLYDTLAAWAQAFGALVDSHTHLVPGVGLSGPPVNLPWTSTAALFATARSTFVTLGG